MASEAGWQPGGTAKHGDTGMPHGDGAMDQRTVESLLRRLVERVEESERRYGEALEELHSRLDQLSHTTEAARATSTPEGADTLHRLHDQVSSLARRLEHETDIPLDDFERLGKVLTGEHYRSSAGGEPDMQTPAAEPHRAPSVASFWQAAQRPSCNDTPFSFPSVQPDFSSPASETLSPEGYDTGRDKRLVDIAQRLEQSIGTAMPTTAIEALNKKMEEISAQLDRALAGPAQREGLEHIERQISDIGQQLGRAEVQIGRLGGIESQLQKLIERDDTMPGQIEETANKAATEAARRVATEAAKPMPDKRIEAIEGKLTTISDESRASTKRLSDTLAAVHASLKELLQQIEKGPSPFARPSRMPVPDRLRESAPQPNAGAPRQVPEARAEKDAPRKEVSAKAPEQAKDASPPADSALPQDRSLRSRLGAAIPDYQDSEAPAAFGRAKRAKLDEDAVDLDAPETAAKGRLTTNFDLDSTDDLVAAARRAAQAASVHAEERAGGSRSKRVRATTTLSGADASGRRTRPLLMVIAALLLVLSAALLYARLKSKPDPDAAPPTTEECRHAASGLAPAQYRLATMCERGQGVTKDVGRARSWYGAAAEKGNVKAMHNLAVSESGREGGVTDYAAAFKWYAQAAAYG
ncbi:MAG: hypothetical protein ACR2J1_10970, partial [Methyloceanibacter sp.]